MSRVGSSLDRSEHVVARQRGGKYKRKDAFGEVKEGERGPMLSRSLLMVFGVDGVSRILLFSVCIHDYLTRLLFLNRVQDTKSEGFYMCHLSL